jgi:hypothetical protein
MARLGHRLGTVDWHAWKPDAVRAAAIDELRADTREREEKGAAAVVTVLPD